MFSAVLNNGTTWVAGGSTSIAYSTTGKTWTTVTGGPTNVNSLAWTGTQWLACCDGSNNLYVSSDAITWTLNTNLSSYTLNKIAFANNTLFALSPGTIFYTTNLSLASWSSHPVAGIGNITGFVYTGTHYRFSSNTTLITTIDLVSWTTSSLPSPSTNLSINNSANGVATVKPIIIACSDSSYNTLGYTYDGIQWYGCGNTVLQNRANHAAWNGNIWVAVGQSAGTWFAISKDGINWQQQQSDNLFTEAYAVAWNGSMWIAAGEGTAFSLARSSDGVNWTGIAGSKTLFPSKAVDVKWNGRKWTACGPPNTVASSFDGITAWLITGVVGDIISVLLQATSSATASSGVNPEYAIDYSDSTAWTSQSSVYTAGLYTGSDPSGGEWIQVNIGTSTTIKQYYLRSNSTQWSLYGSPNGTTTWSLIESRVDTSNVFFATTTNTTPYAYYRFVFEKIVPITTSVHVNSIDFFVANQPLSRFYKLNNTKRWLSSVVNTGYSSIMQYNGVIPVTASPISLPTSYSYDGQYHLMTDLSNASVYYSSENNVLIDVSLSTIAQKYASCFNGTHFFVGGSGANIVYAHPSDMTTWYSVSNADTTFTGGSILALVSNPRLGFVCPPNSLYLVPGDKLSVVAPKFYDENMEKRGAVFLI
jgi:hypothetical protein